MYYILFSHRQICWKTTWAGTLSCAYFVFVLFHNSGLRGGDLWGTPQVKVKLGILQKLTTKSFFLRYCMVHKIETNSFTVVLPWTALYVWKLCALSGHLAVLTMQKDYYIFFLFYEFIYFLLILICCLTLGCLHFSRFGATIQMMRLKWSMCTEI